jgi:hypothetical protein
MQPQNAFHFCVLTRDAGHGKIPWQTLATHLNHIQVNIGKPGVMTNSLYDEMIGKIKEALKDYNGDYKIFHDHVQIALMSYAQISNLAQVLAEKFKGQPRRRGDDTNNAEAVAGLLALAETPSPAQGGAGGAVAAPMAQGGAGGAVAAPMAQGGAGVAGSSQVIRRLKALVGSAQSKEARAKAQVEKLQGQLAKAQEDLETAQRERVAVDKALHEAVVGSNKRKRDQA